MAQTEKIESSTQDVDPNGGLASYTPQQQLALTRFARFEMLRRQELPRLDPSDWHARLIHKALFSAYEDCVAAGVGEEARLFGAREDN